MAWTRSGDFDKTFTEENSMVNRRVIYSNNKHNRVIQQLEIYGFSNNTRIGVGVFLSNDKQLELFLEKLPRLNGPPINVSNKKLRAAMETDNTEILKELLLAAHKLDRLDGHSVKEISSMLKIELPRELDDIIQLANTGKLEEALEMAAASTDQDLCLDAGRYFEQKADNEKSARFYLLISEAHPHYHESILKAYDFINKLLNTINNGKTAVTKEKVMGYEILKLSCIVKMNDHEAHLHAYLGGLQNNQELINKVNALEKEVALLRAQNAKLEQQLEDKDKNLQHFQSTPLLFKRL